jgi:hypothetical protein
METAQVTETATAPGTERGSERGSEKDWGSGWASDSVWERDCPTAAGGPGARLDRSRPGRERRRRAEPPPRAPGAARPDQEGRSEACSHPGSGDRPDHDRRTQPGPCRSQRACPGTTRWRSRQGRPPRRRAIAASPCVSERRGERPSHPAPIHRGHIETTELFGLHICDRHKSGDLHPNTNWRGTTHRRRRFAFPS